MGPGGTGQRPAGSTAAATVTAGAAGTPSTEAGTTVTPAIEVTVTASRIVPPDPANLNDANGRRVRLRPKPGGNASTLIYGNEPGLMDPLIGTNGMLFPYQPSITYQQEVMYSQMEMVHTNQELHSYVRTPALKLTVEGDFTCQNQDEGRYSLACIHFLRTVSKMWFGGESSEARARQGTPPPVLLFDAYGQYMFNNLPVIVTQFSVSLPKEPDYFPVKVSNEDLISARAASFINRPNSPLATNAGYAWLPVQFSISVQLTVQNTPRKLRQFDMTAFNTGLLLKQGGWV